MTAEHWKNHVKNLVLTDDEEGLSLLVQLLEEYDQAKQLLRDKGYGWTGLSLLETVKQIESTRVYIPEIKESVSTWRKSLTDLQKLKCDHVWIMSADSFDQTCYCNKCGLST